MPAEALKSPTEWSKSGLRCPTNGDYDKVLMLVCPEAWQAEKRRIAEEANRKRSAAAKAQHEVSRPYAGEKKQGMVVGQSVPPPLENRTFVTQYHKHKAKEAKAAASKTNAGAVAGLKNRKWRNM